MNKLWLLLIFFVIVLGVFIIANPLQNSTFIANSSNYGNNSVEYTLIEFNNTLVSENISFAGTQSFLRYLTIPRNSVVKSAKTNVSGLTEYCYQETANVSTACGGLSTGKYSCYGSFDSSWPCELSYDGDWWIGSLPSFGTMATLFINYTLPSDVLTSSLWQLAGGVPYTFYNFSINLSCWSQSILQLRIDATQFEPYYNLLQCYNGSNWVITYNLTGLHPGFGGLYEEAMWWNIYPQNITLNIGNDADAEFNNTGVFNTTNTTNDFSGEINDYLTKYNLCYQETANVSTACGGLTNGSYSCVGGYDWVEPTYICSNAFDGNWATQAYVLSGSAYLYINYTKPVGALNSSLWQVRDNAGVPTYPINLSIPFNCWNQTILQFYAYSEWMATVKWACWNNTNWQTLRIDIGNGDYLAEEAMWWNISGCLQDSNGNCQIPLNITSTNGAVNLNTLNITYDYNISTLFNKNDSLTWNTTHNIKINEILKRRYSINPTSNLASNNISLTGYSNRNETATACEVNNAAKAVTGNYCGFTSIINRTQSWPVTYIWDNNISIISAVTTINSSNVASNQLFTNYTLTYLDPTTLANASTGTFTNVTYGFYYNSSITKNQKLEYYSGGTWYDITSTAVADCITSPSYTQKTANGKVFYVCLSTTQKYINLKIESNS